jgi:UDP-N-acetylglucosamine acyltransferase
VVGNHVIMSNATQLAGEVEVDDYAILSGGILVHQFTRIGAHVMIQGGSRVTKDVPPFITAGRDPLSYAGINSIGLRRRGYTNEQIRDIQDVYRYIFLSGMNTSNAVERIMTELPATKERDEILLFIKNSPRGILKGYFEK